MIYGLINQLLLSESDTQLLSEVLNYNLKLLPSLSDGNKLIECTNFNY